MRNLQNVFLGTSSGKTPIWLMRQAGRYMPEYMQIRSKIDSFLDLCYDSEKAAIVALQPVEKFDLDAAILFSDILVLPDALGWKVQFQQGEGPVMEKFSSQQDLERISGDFDDKINNIYETVVKIRSRLSDEVDLIGFAGSPWTVASYMLEGRGKTDFSVSKRFLYEKPALAKGLIDLLADKTIEYLSNQIKAGANIIQLFDSWAGVLNDKLYDEFVIEPTKKIVLELKKNNPDIPIIGFPKGSGFNYEKYILETMVDGLGVDQYVPVKQMALWQETIVVQGNLDPVILLSDKKVIQEYVDNIMRVMQRNRFIFNLGHGILPTTPEDNVEYLVKYIKNFGNE